MFSRASREPFGVAADAHVAPHQALQRVADVGQVQRFGERVDARVLDDRGGEVVAQLGRRPRGPFARVSAVDQRLQQAVARPAGWPRAGRWP